MNRNHYIILLYFICKILSIKHKENKIQRQQQNNSAEHQSYDPLNFASTSLTNNTTTSIGDLQINNNETELTNHESENVVKFNISEKTTVWHQELKIAVFDYSLEQLCTEVYNVVSETIKVTN